MSTVLAYKYSLPKEFHGLEQARTGLFIHTAQVQCELELTRKAQTQLTPRIPLCLTRDAGEELTGAPRCADLWLRGVCARAG